MVASVQDKPRKHRLTVSDYHRMGEVGILARDARVELIEGEIIDMSPIGSRHSAAVNRLVRILSRAVGDSAIVSAQNPLILDDHTEPQSDIALLMPRDDFYAARHPRPEDVLLIVEVADTSLTYDRTVKIPLYGRHGIPEVWLFDVEKGTFWRFAGPVDGLYTEEISEERLGVLALQALPKIKVDLTVMALT
jgi:Uma2 family endonuclease